MKPIHALAAAALALSAATASAGDLRLFFSKEGPDPPETDGVRDLSAATIGPSNPVLDVDNPGTETGLPRLYLWAEMIDPFPSRWDLISIDVNTIGALSITGYQVWNYVFEDLFNDRWTSITTPAIGPGGIDDTIMLTTSTDINTGVSSSAANEAFDDQYHPTLVATVIAWFEFDGAGEVFLGIGNNGILRVGGGLGTESIYFGVGDAPLLNNAYSQSSTIADATIVPEPASLLVLAGLGLAGLRRR
jgi:hypothetical protein